MKTEFNEISQDNENLKNQRMILEVKIRNEISHRKILHNMVEDMKGKVRVYCRVRPLSKSEIDKSCKAIVTVLDDFNIKLETKNGPKKFSYDSCFGPNTTQVLSFFYIII